MSKAFRFALLVPVLLIVFVLAAACAGYPVTAAAAPQTAYVLPHVERLSGLSHNTVLSILQDRQGFLWIGTSDGLNRFDAHDFIVYRHVHGDETSLANNLIKALIEDRDGNLWIGTDRGLDRFDRRADRFVHISLGLDSMLSTQRSVLDLLEDEDGSIWVATNAAGLYHVDPASDNISSYRRSDGLSDDTVWSLYKDRDGTIWITTSNALHSYNPSTDRVERVLTFDGPPPFRVLYKEGSKVWFSNDHGMRAYDLSSGQTVSVPGVPPDAAVNVLHGDSEGARWIGATSGLFRMDPETRQAARFEIDPAPTTYLPNHIKALHEDRTGALWVGTLGGLYRIDPYAKPFHHLSRDPANPGSLGDNTVMAIHEDGDGILWLGTLGGGLYRVDNQRGAIAQFLHLPDKENRLCNDLIWSLAEDNQGRLWIGTETGLCTFDQRTGRFTRHDVPPGHLAGSRAVNDILQDRSGRLWIGTYHGLYEMDAESGTATKATFDTDLSNPAYASVQALYEDRSGGLWVSFFGGTLYRFEPETGVSTRIPLQVEEGHEFVGEGIWAIHEDADGTFWLGGDGGLLRFNPSDSTIYNYSIRDGLPGSMVYAIVEDGPGKLWISTNHGIFRLEPGQSPGRRIRIYGTGDGLRNTEFNRRAAFKSPRGELFFGGLDGLTRFFPEQIGDNAHVPPVALTSIVKAGRDAVVSVNPFGLQRLVLTHQDTRVTFQFAALSFSNPSQNNFAYRLRGFDKNWVDAGKRRTAEYTNVPPGEYVFEVKGSNNDGLWSEAGVGLAILKLPPFWQTWWFRLVMGACVVGLLAALYRYRVQHLIEIERMRLRIAGDLHDDIGSNLSSIALLSDMVKGRERLDERERDQLSRISLSARAMVAVLRDIVWSIDPEADTPHELLQRMEDAAAAMLGGIQWTIHRPIDVPGWELSMEVRRHVFLIYKEALHNILRHARATEVTISLDEDRGEMRLAITDDGIGFNPATVRRGNGLSNLQKRTAEIGGEMQVRSAPGAGTTIELRMPLHRRRLVKLCARKRRKRAVHGM